MRSSDLLNKGNSIRTLRETVTFGVVGGLNTGIDLLAFYLLYHFAHWDPVSAQVVSYACGLVNSFVWNRTVTFRRKGPLTPREVIRFVTVNGVSWAMSIVVLTVLRHVDVSIAPSKLAATLVPLGINFSGSKWWVFRQKVAPLAAHRKSM